MTETIGWLAGSLFCAVIGGVLGVALIQRRTPAGADHAHANRD